MRLPWLESVTQSRSLAFLEGVEMGLRAERSVAHRASPSLTVAAFFVSRKRPSAGNGHASLLPFYLQSVGRRSCEMHASSVFAFFTCCVMDGGRGVLFCVCLEQTCFSLGDPCGSVGGQSDYRGTFLSGWCERMRRRSGSARGVNAGFAGNILLRHDFVLRVAAGREGVVELHGVRAWGRYALNKDAVEAIGKSSPYRLCGLCGLRAWFGVVCRRAWMA